MDVLSYRYIIISVLLINSNVTHLRAFYILSRRITLLSDAEDPSCNKCMTIAEAAYSGLLYHLDHIRIFSFTDFHISFFLP